MYISFFLIVDSCFSILAVVAQIFNPFQELVIPIGRPRKEGKVEIEIQQNLK